MLVLHGALFLKEWSYIPIGLPDFSIFYTAGTTLRQGRGANLYNDDLQDSIQRSFFPSAVEKRGSILLFNHPPFEAVFFLPFATVSFLTAYLVWLAINVATTLWLLLLLRQHLPALGKLPLWLWLLAGFGFFPVFVALMQGQDSVFVLLCYGMAFLALRRNSDFTAGAWLGVGLCKFHLILPFLLAPLLQKKGKLFAGFVTMAAILALVGIPATGWQGLLQYPAYAWHTEHSLRYRWNALHGNTPNLRGVLVTILPKAHLHLAIGLVLTGSVALIGVAVYLWRCSSSADPTCRQLAFALNLVATVLVSYHAFAYDLSLLLLPILLVLDVLLTSPLIRGWTRKAVLVCTAVLFCTPLYLILMLGYNQLQAISAVVIVFFIAIASATFALTRQADAAGLTKAAEPIS